MSGNKSFFQTLPGILTGLAAVLSAATGLYIAFKDDLPNDSPGQGVVELSVDSFSFDPMPPTQNRPVVVTSLVRNSGNAEAKNVLIEWWPGVNFPDPVTKIIPQIQEGEVERVSFNYPGYRSWYGQIETKVMVNSNNAIIEQNYDNNTLAKKIAVLKDRN
jgi:hypothetical protein